MIIILIIIIISLGKMLLSYNYFKHIAHAVVISTHGKGIGYVIIPKPNLSSRECINSCCRRFDFSPFGSISRRYDRSSRRSDCRVPTGLLCSTMTVSVAVVEHAATRFSRKFVGVFRLKKIAGPP